MEQRNSLITKMDLVWASFKWYLLAWQCINYERFVSLGLTSSINHILAKLYKDEDALKEALMRHLEFFNTEPYLGVVIMGIVIAMEEERAEKGEDQMPPSMISAVKTGLMGPIAGIGDTLNQAVLMPLFLAVSVGVTIDSNISILGPIIFIILNCGVMGAETWFFTQFGYKYGKMAASKILMNGLMDKIVNAASVVGCAVMGGLIASCINVSTKINLGMGISLQTDLLDVIMPKMLPLAIVFICFGMLKKNVTPMKVTVFVAIIAGMLAAIGII